MHPPYRRIYRSFFLFFFDFDRFGFDSWISCELASELTLGISVFLDFDRFGFDSCISCELGSEATLDLARFIFLGSP
jgi:hypothetical protein